MARVISCFSRVLNAVVVSGYFCASSPNVLQEASGCFAPASAMPSFSSRYPELTSPAAAWERFCNNASRRKALYRAIKPRIEAKVRARNASATYSERSFFDGDACQHCADRDEHLRLNRLRQSVDRTRRSSFAFAGQRVGQGRAA